MLSLQKCLRDIANAWPKISVGTQTGSLKIGSLLIQWGNTSLKMTATTGAKDITFPTAYSSKPIVIGQCTDSTLFPDLFNITVYNIDTAKFTMGFRNNHSTYYTLAAVWIAIGKA